MSARIPGRLALSALIACLVFVGGCRDDSQQKGTSEQAASEQQEQTQARGEEPAAKTASGSAEVYPLTQPGPEATPEEQASAQEAVTYANTAGSVIVDGVCGRYPMQIMRMVEEYKTLFAADRIAGPEPAQDCAVKGVPAPEAAMFGEENAASMSADLKTMDQASRSMQEKYRQLQSYVQDRKIRDDGQKGDQLSGEITASYALFRDARRHFLKIMNAKAEEAQDTLLRSSPLRAQVRMARRIFEDFRQCAEFISAGEPDQNAMAALVDKAAADITTAENLPFPVAGVVEMSYRTYLKGARAVEAAFRRGISESFHAPVRVAINTAWQECGAEYNSFVDAMGDTSVRKP